MQTDGFLRDPAIGGFFGPVDPIDIGDGSVDETEFGRLDGILGPIQDQLDGKADLSDVQLSAVSQTLTPDTPATLYSATSSDWIEGSIISDSLAYLSWAEGSEVYTSTILAGRTVAFSYPQLGTAATLTILSASAAVISGEVRQRTRFE